MAVTIAGSSTFVEALVAGGPAPERAQAMMLYGRFVGEWDFDWTGYDAEGNELLSTRGEWLFAWALEGRAVQDVWICPSRTIRRSGDAPQATWEYGTTLRFYDASIGMWRVVWIGPGNGNVRIFVAHAAGDDIVQHSANPQAEPIEWRFTDIADDAFTWCGRKLDGGTWRLTELMRARRR